MKLITLVVNRVKISLDKAYRLFFLFFHGFKAAIAKPKYFYLAFWAFKQLSWVDRDLQNMAISALQTPAKEDAPLSLDLQKAIKERVNAIAHVAKIHPSRPKCLHRSLALYHWLLKQGIFTKLEIGWSDNIGHAWITYDGLVLNDVPNIAELTPPFVKNYSKVPTAP